MMGVYIKGMKMPEYCTFCPMFNHDTGDCNVLGIQGKDMFIGRSPDCPLVDVPTPHGRLIDADRLDKHILYAPIAGVIAGDGPFWTNIVYEKHINSAPTVIEAEDDDVDYEYEQATDMRNYCERYEPTYNPEDGSM